jgi:hypothetical protein
MKTITLQTTGVPLKTKQKADKRAKKEGFNSVQDLVRIFLKDYSEGRYEVSLNLRARHPEVRQSLDEYERGEYIEVNPNKDIFAQILSHGAVQNRNDYAVSTKTSEADRL